MSWNNKEENGKPRQHYLVMDVEQVSKISDVCSALKIWVYRILSILVT
jgi:hypothetical protein